MLDLAKNRPIKGVTLMEVLEVCVYLVINALLVGLMFNAIIGKG